MQELVWDLKATQNLPVSAQAWFVCPAICTLPRGARTARHARFHICWDRVPKQCCEKLYVQALCCFPHGLHSKLILPVSACRGLAVRREPRVRPARGADPRNVRDLVRPEAQLVSCKTDCRTDAEIKPLGESLASWQLWARQWETLEQRCNSVLTGSAPSSS